MLGKKKNIPQCVYGCCRALFTGTKKKTNRVLRAREKRAWKKEQD